MAPNHTLYKKPLRLNIAFSCLGPFIRHPMQSHKGSRRTREPGARLVALLGTRIRQRLQFLCEPQAAVHAKEEVEGDNGRVARVVEAVDDCPVTRAQPIAIYACVNVCLALQQVAHASEDAERAAAASHSFCENVSWKVSLLFVRGWLLSFECVMECKCPFVGERMCHGM